MKMTKEQDLFMRYHCQHQDPSDRELAEMEIEQRTPKRRHYPETDNEQKGKLRCK